MDSEGRVMVGNMAAPDELSLAEALAELGAEIIEAKEKRAKMRREKTKSATAKDVTTFFGQMEEMLRSGITAADALAFSAASLQRGSMRDAISAISLKVSQGTRVNEAFAERSDIFGRFCAAVLTAGEVSGDLASAFARIKAQTEKREDRKRKIAKALRYPAFLLVVALAVSGFMLLSVIPRVADFLNAMSGELPASTKALLWVADAFSTLFRVAVLGGAAGAAAILLARKFSKKAEEKTDEWLIGIPLFGNVLRGFALAEFSYTLSALLKSGVLLSDGINVAAKVMGNKYLEKAAQCAASELASGALLSSAARRVYPQISLRMLALAENGGSLCKALDEISALHENESRSAAENFTGLVEPTLTVAVGAFLAWVVLAVLGPVYGSLNGLGGASL